MAIEESSCRREQGEEVSFSFQGKSQYPRTDKPRMVSAQ